MGLKLNATNGGGSVELDVPDTVSSDVVLTLPTGIGTAGQYLKNSATPGTLEFGTLPATGKILQVVQASGTGTVTNTTTTFAVLRSPSITPSSTSNYILIFAHCNLQIIPNANQYGEVAVFYGDTSGTQISSALNGSGSTTGAYHGFSIIAKHEPASTSSETYTFAMRKASGSTTSVNTDNTKYEIILMEVEG